MALSQVADVVLVEILIEGCSQQLLGQVGEDGCGSADTHTHTEVVFNLSC